MKKGHEWSLTFILKNKALYSTRIKELGNWREAISVKRLGFMIKFFTTKCTYRCTMLFKVLEPFQRIHFFLSKKFFFCFWLILTTKITLKKILSYVYQLDTFTQISFFVGDFPPIFVAMAPKTQKTQKVRYFLKFSIKSSDFWCGSSVGIH